MFTIFIAGSIKIKNLDPKVKSRIDNVIESGLSVVVGDADGADTAIQQYLVEKGWTQAVVFCSGSRPRNNLGNWPVEPVVSASSPGSREFYAAKDRKMAEVADYGLMVWDCKSTGTLGNVIELLNKQKKSVVFVNKAKKFITVADVKHLEELLSFMSQDAIDKAEKKLSLTKRISSLKLATLRQSQPEMF